MTRPSLSRPKPSGRRARPRGEAPPRIVDADPGYRHRRSSDPMTGEPPRPEELEPKRCRCQPRPTLCRGADGWECVRCGQAVATDGLDAHELGRLLDGMDGRRA